MKSTKSQCYCGKSFRSSHDLSNHQTLHCHTLEEFRKTGLVKCNKCPKTFKCLKDLELHQREDSLTSPQCPNAITCGTCGNGFNTIDYQDHVSNGNCCNLEKPYRCLKCGISFKVESSYSHHVQICSQKLETTEHGMDHQMFEKNCDKCGLKFNSIRGWLLHIRKCGKKPIQKHGFEWHHHQNCHCSNCSRRIRRRNLKSHSKQSTQYSKWKANVSVNGQNVEVDLGSEMTLFDDASQPIRKKTTSKHKKSAKRRSRNKPKPYSSPMDPFEILCDIYEWLEFFLVDSEWFEWLIFHLPYFTLNSFYTGIYLLRWLDSHRIHLLVNSEWIDFLIFHIPHFLLNSIHIGINVIRRLMNSTQPSGIHIHELFEVALLLLITCLLEISSNYKDPSKQITHE